MGPDATVLVAPDAEAAGTVPAGEAASLAGEDLAFLKLFEKSGIHGIIL